MPDAGAHRTVLVADGDQSIRSLVYLTLHSERTTVVEAGDADEAVERVASGGAEVALVDFALPDGGGVDACARLKEAAASVRTILLVRKADLDEVPADVPADAVLTKPFTSLSLLRKVDETLEAGGV